MKEFISSQNALNLTEQKEEQILDTRQSLTQMGQDFTPDGQEVSSDIPKDVQELVSLIQSPKLSNKEKRIEKKLKKVLTKYFNITIDGKSFEDMESLSEIPLLDIYLWRVGDIHINPTEELILIQLLSFLSTPKEGESWNPSYKPTAVLGEGWGSFKLETEQRGDKMIYKAGEPEFEQSDAPSPAEFIIWAKALNKDVLQHIDFYGWDSWYLLSKSLLLFSLYKDPDNPESDIIRTIPALNKIVLHDRNQFATTVFEKIQSQKNGHKRYVLFSGEGHITDDKKWMRNSVPKGQSTLTLTAKNSQSKRIPEVVTNVPRKIKKEIRKNQSLESYKDRINLGSYLEISKYKRYFKKLGLNSVDDVAHFLSWYEKTSKADMALALAWPLSKLDTPNTLSSIQKDFIQSNAFIYGERLKTYEQYSTAGIMNFLAIFEDAKKNQSLDMKIFMASFDKHKEEVKKINESLAPIEFIKFEEDTPQD